jgi:TetR/AcrR family transcriptional repressor of nem operon
MPKPSNREQILKEGFRVVLERGYCGASVRDIVEAAGVPQGSFTNHFESKDAFCLEVLERYFDLVRTTIEETRLCRRCSGCGSGSMCRLPFSNGESFATVV